MSSQVCNLCFSVFLINRMDKYMYMDVYRYNIYIYIQV